MSFPSDGSHAPATGEGSRASARPPSRPSLIGAVLGGRYLVERLIGEGGMGAVYQAEHTHMRKRLAVKVLHPEMSRLPEVVARFEREAMAAGHMDHPNVAGATDFGKLEDGSFFLVLEYVEGKSLRDAIAEGRLALDRALHVTRQIASALARAHALGIVHRDLKPENIMLVVRDGDPDFVKVLDFGIAKVPVGDLAGDGPLGHAATPALTQLGMVYGTPEYMAPEQALGQPVDARADLYALGVMTFEMIAGARPYSHESKVTLLGMHVTAPIPRLADRAPDADVPPEVDALVTRLLAKDASARFADARELIDTLDGLVSSLRARGRIAAPLAAGGIAGPRASLPEAANASALALGPTRWAERTPGPGGAPGWELASAQGGVWQAPLRAVQKLRSRLGELGRLSAAARSWSRSRRAAVVASVGGVLAVGLLLMGTSGRGGPAPKGAATARGSSAPPRLVHWGESATDALVANAQATIDRGDFATAIDALTAIEKKNPGRADVHKLLERAYTGVRNPREALREAGLWLVSDANAASDATLQEDVRNAALVRDVQDEAFSLLESKMSTAGVDILYDIAYGASGRLYPQAAARARRSLEAAEVRERASSALGWLLDFRAAKGCDEKRQLLERGRDQADARALTVLQPYTATRGCGFFGRSDCYPCLHKDHLLADTMAAIQDRAVRAEH